MPFIVHGISGEQLSQWEKTNPRKLKGLAVERFKSNGFILGIGQGSQPESLYDNPQLYPQMFPWLFPYGHGGVRNQKIQKHVADRTRKQ